MNSCFGQSAARRWLRSRWRRKELRAATGVRHRAGAFSDFEVDGRRTWRRPTSSSSASSTTIRTRIGWSSRCSRPGASRPQRASSSLEMFERDAQEPLEHFLMGHMDGGGVPQGVAPVAALCHRLQAARRFRDRTGVAGRCRQRAAPDRVGGREGRPGRAERRARRRPASCSRASACARPTTTYFKRFARPWAAIRRAGAAGDEARRTTERYYFSQCVKDETMAESIAQAFAATRSRKPARRARQRRVPQRLPPGHRRARRPPAAGRQHRRDP